MASDNASSHQDAIDDALAQLNAEVERLIADIEPSLRRRDRRYVAILLRDRLSALVHRSIREGARLVHRTLDDLGGTDG